MAKVNIKQIIKDLGDTKWSTDNAAQMKAVQLLKGLALSDEELANKFMVKMDQSTTNIAKELLGTSEPKEKEEKELEETEEKKEEKKKEEEKKKKKLEDKQIEEQEILIANANKVLL